MAHIVNLSDYRKPPKGGRAAPAAASADQAAEPHYYCLSCDTDAFKLASSGVVHCAHCRARMRNLLVSETVSAKAGDTQPSEPPT